jgi:acetoin utilization deacetylase AcuC-like enzyme
MRPPGHHAEAGHAMGFCLFNNVVVAARWLQTEAGVKKIAILDWDVHHGNGTQHSTYNDADVYYISLHQYPHYPGTGRPEERGPHNTNLNLILPPGAPAEQWMDSFHTQAIPELEKFAPDFLLISCGFDAHRMDPLSHQYLETHHFVEMTRAVQPLAGGRIVSLLEGGYNLHALAECSIAHFRTLQED